jgi:hypothetical protein
MIDDLRQQPPTAGYQIRVRQKSADLHWIRNERWCEGEDSMKKSELLARIETLEKRVSELESRHDIDVTITNKTSMPKYVGVTVHGWENFRSSNLMFTRSEIEQMATAAIKKAATRL